MYFQPVLDKGHAKLPGAVRRSTGLKFAAANLLPEELSVDQYQQEVMPAGCHADPEPGKADVTKQSWEQKS